MSLLALLTIACGEDPEAVSAGSGQNTSDAATGTCAAGQTQSCTCQQQPAATGLMTCFNGAWLGCDCYVAPVPGVAVSGDCLPGRYLGNFIGTYNSGFTFGGSAIPVVGVDLSGQPPLLLKLEENTSSGGGSVEFPTYSVSEGYIKGTADGVFPFEAKLTGSLDCATKKFVGEMDGWYALLLDTGMDSNRGYFKGPLLGTYDAAGHSFTFGTWNVMEYKSGAPLPGYGLVLTQLGGSGSWEAKHESTVANANSAPDAGP